MSDNYYDELFIKIIKDNKYNIFVELNGFLNISFEIFCETIKVYNKNPEFYKLLYDYIMLSKSDKEKAIEVAMDYNCMEVIIDIINGEPSLMTNIILELIILKKMDNIDIKNIINNIIYYTNTFFFYII